MRDGLLFGWLASPARHLEGVDDELGADVIGDRPAHDASVERVEHDREIDVAVDGWVLGDVHHPQPVRAVGVELAADEIVVGDAGEVTARAAPSSAPPDALDAGLAHETLHPLA